MNITMKAGKASDFENIAGWVIEFETGQRQFMRGISREGAFRTADKSNRPVRSVRGFTLTGEGRDRVYTILA